MAALTAADRDLRLTAQLLSGPPAAGPVDVVRRLLAVQAQDPRGARLAVRARTEGLLAADVDRALSVERSLLISWLNRGTLHLVESQDYWWLHQLTTPPLLTGNARRLAQEGVTPDAAERGVAVIAGSLAADGPLTRPQLRERVAAAGVRVEGQALVHLLMLATLRGWCVRGPMVGGEQAYALVHDWLGTPPRVMDRTAALARLAERFLAGHGPATDRDLAKWAGLPLRDARLGLAQLTSSLIEGDGGLVYLPGRAPAAGPARPRLLGAFEPLLVGWTSRAPILGANQSVVTVNGIFRPFALAGGVAVATWALPGKRLALTPFAELDPGHAAALDADAADVVRFLGTTRYR